jgi:hypothetical protein
MSAAGVNWLRIEVSQGLPLSLSLALLTGAAVSAAVCAVLAWIAVLVGGRFSWAATIAIIAVPTLLDLLALVALFGTLPQRP